jgi:VWFA-related protein
VDLVNVHFTVCNRKGRPVRNLDRDDFHVYEDDRRQMITNFSREADVPMTIALLLDTSGSVRYELSFEREAARRFLVSILRPGADKAAVFSFASGLDLRAHYTDNPVLLAEALQVLRSGGGTRLYDALSNVLNGSFDANEGRRAIILLSDGQDNLSRTLPIDVVETAQRNNVAIYAISVNSVGSRRMDDSANADAILKMLASETGGKAFFPKAADQLAAFFDIIRKDLQSLYTIAYRSTNLKRDGAFRRIRVEVGNADYSVHSRAGYYAPEEK